MSVKDAGIWELLNEYADIRDELEDTLQTFELLQFELTSAIEDIQDELEDLEEHLSKCSSRLIRFKQPRHQQCEDAEALCELPFNNIL